MAFGQDGSALRGVVSVSGQNTAALSSFLSEAGLDVRIDGKTLRISKGELAGKTPVADLAGYFKNSVGGVATSVPQGTPVGMAGLASAGSLTLHPEGNSVSFRAILVSADSDENFLVSLVNAGLGESAPAPTPCK